MEEEEVIETIELLENHVLRVVRDDQEVESPNDWEDTEIFLVYDHRQFCIERKGYEPKDIYDYLNNVINNSIEEGVNNKYENYFIFPVFAYIHSGVSLSLAHQGCRFDVSCSGYILVDKNDFDFELQRHHNEELKDKVDLEIAEHYAENLIKTWNTYLSGEIYRVNLYKIKRYLRIYFPLPRDEDYYRVAQQSDVYKEEELVDSFGGYYGLDIPTLLGDIPNHLYDKEIINKHS